MKPNASLKSLKMKVRAIASRPGVSAHSDSPLRADFRASADSRSAMIASRFTPALPYHRSGPSGSLPKSAAKPVQGRAGNHAADVTPLWREICYNVSLTAYGNMTLDLKRL